MEEDDSMMMTIDFLRARLLSERSVSRSARQRADELAKRVQELEEQLNFISLQRKKAEKATSHVLALLENHDDFVDSDTGSSQEEVEEEEEGNNNNKDDQMSKVMKNNNNNNGEDQMSGWGSEDFSPAIRPGTTSLSWKTNRRHNTHHHSGDKKKHTNSSSSKRSTSYSSLASSSPKHHRSTAGKSCRQIRRSWETRMEELRIENIVPGSHGSSVISSSEGTRNCSESGTELLGQGSEIMEETNSRHFLNGHGGGNKDMERALEQQAQLIGRYEDEEKAQRDWEERFRENNNSSPPDSCEPGNQSDITEERDEIKTRTSDEIAPNDQTAKSGKIEIGFAKEICKEPQTIFQPPAHGCESQVSECMVNEKQAKDQLQNYPHYPPSNNYQGSLPCESLKNQTPPFISSNTQNESHAIVPHIPVGDFGGVLEALKQAKSSLQHRLDKLPLLEGGSVGRRTITVPNPSTTKSKTKMEIPAGCANLFRVPSDSQFEATSTKPSPYMGNRTSVSKNDHLMPPFSYLEKRSSDLSNDRQSIPNPYMENKPGVSNNDRFTPNPYMETRLNISRNDRLMPSPYREPRLNNDGFITSSRYMEEGSRISLHGQFVDPYIKAAIPPSSRYAAYPAMAFRNMPSTSTSGGGVSSSAEHFSFYDDHIREPPNMYYVP